MMSRLADASPEPVSAAGARRFLPSSSPIAAMRRWQSQAWCQQRITALLSPGSVVSASGKGFAIAKHHQAVALYTPATAKLHKKALPSVSASQSQAPFVAATASRPTGEGNTFYAKLRPLGPVASRRRRHPGRLRALAPSPVRPMCRPAPWP